MKLLITTRADKNLEEMTKLTHPIIKEYAKKCGADFMQLDHVSGCTEGNGKWHYRIFKHFELHEEYDRILHLDSDVVLNKNIINLFDYVPYEKIGSLLEDKGSRKTDRQRRMYEAQQKFGDIQWSNGYINTGVFLTSKIHKEIFQTINDQYWVGNGFDDVHLGYQINKHKFEMFELPFQLNHMTMFSESWNNNANRFDSYIIHYAGNGVFDPGVANSIEQIKKDIGIIYGEEFLLSRCQ